jgi:trigger factor
MNIGTDLVEMQVTELAAEGLQRAYQVVVPAESLAAAREKRLAELGANLRVPGFRPGKVPASVVKQRYGAAVASEVLEEGVSSAMREVISERGLRPALQPKVEVVNFSEGQDLEFRLDLEVLPEITVPDLSDLTLERLKATPSDEQIEKALAEVAKRNRKLEDVAEARPAAKGDVVVSDFVGRLEGEEEPFPGGSASDMPIEVAGEGFIPGFTEQLEGIAPGETRTISVTFPAEYGAAELAGKAARFEVTAKALKQVVLPPVDDALAAGFGLADLATLKGEIRNSIQREYDQLARLKVKRALLDALAERAGFPVPEGMVEAEFGRIWPQVEADLKAGRLDEEDAGKDEETLKADYRRIAERRIRLGLLLSEIGRANSIDVTAEELNRAVRQEATRYPGQEKQFFDFIRKNPQATENLRAPLFEEKVVDYLLELAKVTEREVAPEELSAAA